MDFTVAVLFLHCNTYFLQIQDVFKYTLRLATTTYTHLNKWKLAQSTTV